LPARSEPTVVLGEVSIPRYLDREAILTRVTDERVTYSKRDRWAEPLDAGFERVLKQDLAAALAPAGITVPRRTALPTYEVQVEVLRFERRADEGVELRARWTVRSESQLIHADESRVRVPTRGADNAAATVALSHAISQLADAIADQVKHATAVARAERRPK
jgi:uncharacterized lipoprotein YmbA